MIDTSDHTPVAEHCTLQSASSTRAKTATCNATWHATQSRPEPSFLRTPDAHKQSILHGPKQTPHKSKTWAWDILRMTYNYTLRQSQMPTHLT